VDTEMLQEAIVWGIGKISGKYIGLVQEPGWFLNKLFLDNLRLSGNSEFLLRRLPVLTIQKYIPFPSGGQAIRVFPELPGGRSIVIRPPGMLYFNVYRAVFRTRLVLEMA